MEIRDTIFGEVLILENKKHLDERGSFQELFNRRRLGELIPELTCAQVNLSRSLPGVVRGLHFQFDPPQGKLVTAMRGAIWDVVVDLRAGSRTFGRHFSIELTEDNGVMLWIPPGFAHGICVSGDAPADLLYVTDAFYNPRAEGGVFWLDPELAIPWPVRGDAILSARDQALPSLRALGLRDRKPDHGPVARVQPFPLP